MRSAPLKLHAGMAIPFAGQKMAFVSPELAAAFAPGDALIVLQQKGELLRIPAAARSAAKAAVDAATAAFTGLKAAEPERLRVLFRSFAGLLAGSAAWDAIEAANAADVDRARAAGRATGRLALRPVDRAAMIAGLALRAEAPAPRAETYLHDGWRLELARAPLGVVGFVFEGRPNVVADAAGVIANGNVAVLRIGADALGTARAILAEAAHPALAEAGLPSAALTLLDIAGHEAAWALFSEPRLSLAVARGSGAAVAMLGEIARQAGTPASLHGTGGAWLVADASADTARFAAALEASLDRKVCNTMNVCLIDAARAHDLLPELLAAFARAGGGALRVATGSEGRIPAGTAFEPLPLESLGMEWEWDEKPEISLAVVGGLDEAIALFNRYSPRLAASLIADDEAAQERFWREIEAPFVGNGMTRWVDGQWALGRPELGISNWQAGRLFGRGGVLSSDDVFTLRARMRQDDPELRR